MIISRIHVSARLNQRLRNLEAAKLTRNVQRRLALPVPLIHIRPRANQPLRLRYFLPPTTLKQRHF